MVKSRWLVPVVVAFASRFAEAQTCSTTTEAGYTYEVSPTTDLTVFWDVDIATDLASFKVTYAGTAWVSLGFSDAGDMVGSDCVIGLPTDESIAEYDLTSKRELPGVSPVPEITVESVTQAAGETTISFTRPLAPTGAGKQLLSSTPGDTTVLIWGVGSDNDLGIHTGRGGLSVDLFCSTAAVTTLAPSPVASVQPSTLVPEATVAATLAPSPAPSVEPSTLAPVGTSSPEVFVSTDPEYEFEMRPEDTLTIFWSVLEDTSEISVKAVHTGAAWVGVGFSGAGGLMVPGDAVVALPDNETVLEYALTAYDLPDSYTDQELMSTSLSQIGGLTTMTFVRPLSPSSAEKQNISSTGDVSWIYGVGSANEFDFHEVFGSRTLSLSNPVGEANKDLSCVSDDPDYDFETSPEDSLTIFWSLLEDTDEISMKVVYQGQGWVSVGFSGGGGKMVPGDCVIGLPDDSAQEYLLSAYDFPDLAGDQELTSSSVTQDDGVTTLTFVRPMTPSSTDKQILLSTAETFLIYGVGSSNTFAFHSIFDSLSLTLDNCNIESANIDRPQEEAHGWLMTLGWGVLMPLGVITARFARPKNAWWFKAHRAMMLMALVMALVGLALAVVFTEDKGRDHFVEGHALYGIILMALFLLQVSLAFVRPNVVPKQGEEGYSIDRAPMARRRSMWEKVHRLLGGVVLVWGIFQIYSGFDELDVADKWLWSYTGVLILLVAIFVMLQLVRLFSKDKKKGES